MKKTALLLVITLIATSFGFSQVLGPPDYNVVEEPHAKITANDVAPNNTTSFSAECSVNEMCVIDHPRPIDNPLLKTSSSIVMTKAQLNVQPLPVIYVKNATTPPGISNKYRCAILDVATKSHRSQPRMICTAVDNNVGGE